MPAANSTSRISKEKSEDLARQMQIKLLSGEGKQKAHPISISPPNKGGKFSPDGDVMHFPGNTFICHVDQTSDFYKRLCGLQDALMELDTAENFVFLPKPSFHMTIFAGVCGVPLGEDGWPRDIAPETPLEAINETFIQRASTITAPDGFRVRPTGLRAAHSLTMQGADEGEENLLWDMRKKLQTLTGLHRDSFEDYYFHITLAYLLRWLNAEEAENLTSKGEELYTQFFGDEPVLNLAQIEFCTFRTMFKFDTTGTIGPNGYKGSAAHIPC